MAASVRTRVVSWNEAADTNDCVVSDAFVMPSSSGSAVAGCRFSRFASSFASRKVERSTCSPSSSGVWPGSMIRTFCSICFTITPMCLSLIFTPCRR